MNKRYKRHGRAIKYEDTRHSWLYFFRQYENDKEFRKGAIECKNDLESIQMFTVKTKWRQ